MEDKQRQEAAQNEVGKRGSLKWKVYLVLLVVLIGAGTYGYFWYEKTNSLRVEAVQAIAQAEKFDLLQKAVSDEKTRCEQFIAQKEGNFESFEYCKKFLDWVKTTTTLSE